LSESFRPPSSLCVVVDTSSQPDRPPLTPRLAIIAVSPQARAIRAAARRRGFSRPERRPIGRGRPCGATVPLGGTPNVSRSGVTERAIVRCAGHLVKIAHRRLRMCGSVLLLVRPVRDAAPTESPMLPPHQARKERVMALSSTFVVHVDKPAETLLSEYFAEMRIWLDDHKIAPTDFHLFGGPIVGLEVRFSSPEQAALFEQEFGPKNQPTTIVPLIFANHSAS
jgi:hypothetical protein